MYNECNNPNCMPEDSEKDSVCMSCFQHPSSDHEEVLKDVWEKVWLMVGMKRYMQSTP